MQPIPIWLKRRIFLREQRAEDVDVVFRSDLIFKLREFHRDFPPNVLPILSGGPELQRFRTFPAIGLSNADRDDARVHPSFKIVEQNSVYDRKAGADRPLSVRREFAEIATHEAPRRNVEIIQYIIPKLIAILQEY